MKTIIPLVAALLVLPGCLPTKWARQIPENKDFRGRFVSIWGTLEVDSRVNPAGNNPLPPLANPGSVTVLTNGSIILQQ